MEFLKPMYFNSRQKRDNFHKIVPILEKNKFTNIHIINDRQGVAFTA